jgi:EAL domain-containing protein (putative c-di-GMP-specific phosphodiesterase class I)
MQKELHRITTMKHQIKSALQEKKFINYFQPIVSSKDHTIKGAEILLRWFNGRELISPTIFIPILEEEISLIKEVTFWQIEEIIKILPKNDLYYAINISAKLLNMELLEELKRLKKKYNFKSSRIHFEVTETSLSTNLMQASEVLAEIKDMGFYLSLDDFGTGYSSLAYLRELSFDTLKIDKKFIDDAFKSAKNKKLLFAIMNMAKILEMKIVLEGIEESYQLEIVEEASYVKLQGFLFYKPMIEKEFLKITSASPKRK